MTRTLTILLSASLGVAACSDSIDTPTPPPDNTPPPGSTTGDSGSTFDHPNDGVAVWDLLKRLTDQGPPSFTSQMHACMKMHYATLGNVLSSLGVNLTNTTANSAGQLYQSGGPAMSVANYPARVRESVTLSTSQASRELDIFAAAAPEIIAAMPTVPRCQIAGAGPSLFDAGNQCQLAGISCLIATPATQAHVDLCNQTITRASTPDVGKRLAVAVMLAAAYTCE
jgi:hypothetical protein